MRAFLPESPIFFYVNSCFALSGAAVTCVFVLAFIYNDLASAVLAAVFMLVNYEDTSRVNFSVNERELFALPCFWAQLSFIVYALKSAHASWFMCTSIAALTFCYALFWQYASFALFFHSSSLYILFLCKPRRGAILRRILVAETLGLALAIVAQFGQVSLFASAAMCLNISMCIASVAWPSRFFDVRHATVQALLASALFTFLFSSANLLSNEQADLHILHIISAKFGLKNIQFDNFATSIYLCRSAFAFLGYDFVQRTRQNGLLPLYSISLLATFCVGVYKFKRCTKLVSSPHLLLTLHSIFYGALAIIFMRMKYLCVPLMAILASSVFNYIDRFVSRYARYALIMAIALKLSADHYAFYRKIMSHTQVSIFAISSFQSFDCLLFKEFYDRDTVEVSRKKVFEAFRTLCEYFQLMKWINREPSTHIFAGSTQLMASVLLCTQRATTNSAHLGGRRLQERTQRVNKIYARTPINRVYEALKAENVTHIIVETNLCNQRSYGCALKGLSLNAIEK